MAIRYYQSGMRTISLKLPDDLLVRRETEATVRHVTKSELVRDSIEKALRERRGRRKISCYDPASDLAGCIKELPEDIADNPKYMEGFGE
jgi:hypothetical protein